MPSTHSSRPRHSARSTESSWQSLHRLCHKASLGRGLNGPQGLALLVKRRLEMLLSIPMEQVMEPLHVVAMRLDIVRMALLVPQVLLVLVVVVALVEAVMLHLYR